jgi:hypothetical protein
VNLSGFPRRTLRGDQTIHRIHRTARGPWWFSADGSGRFDPVGTGHGACYLTSRPVGACVEVFRKQMLIPEAETLERALLSVELGRDLRLADLTSRRALAYGLTATVSVAESYAISHRFAAAAVAAGYEGVRYLVRHDPAQKLYGYALFGPAGAPDPADPRWPVGSDAPIPEELVQEARRLFRYRVLPVP